MMVYVVYDYYSQCVDSVWTSETEAQKVSHQHDGFHYVSIELDKKENG